VIECEPRRAHDTATFALVAAVQTNIVPHLLTSLLPHAGYTIAVLA
jgi:hypothetical protein